MLATSADLITAGLGVVGLTAFNPATGNPEAAPVFRLFDQVDGTNFFSGSASERDGTANQPAMAHGSAMATVGDMAAYQFFDTQFYKDTASELATVLQFQLGLAAEGMGFQAPAYG